MLSEQNMLKDTDVARRIGVSLAAVRRWRITGRGPRALKIGVSVRYRVEDLEAWIASLPTLGSDGEEG
jgi:predicted DNA-binding transcriptional regulator AlpA